MTHSLVLALYSSRQSAAQAAESVRDLGIDRGKLSIVARSHQEEGELAQQLGGTPGAEIEDSRIAARWGEFGGHILAAMAIAVPGGGSLLSAGPLAAELGEAAGHAAGGVAAVLTRAGLTDGQAAEWQRRIEQGAVLLGVHVDTREVGTIESALRLHGPIEVIVTTWAP